MKLGRQPRKHDPRVPHLSALLAGQKKIVPPLDVDWTATLNSSYGMMANDRLGDCTCASIYHARQVWTKDAGGTEITESDDRVIQLYEEACGYNPGDSSTDNGGVEQDVLTYLLNTGMPIGDGTQRDKLLGFVEVDPRNLDDVRRTIAECGGCYIGFEVPDTLMANGPPTIWSDTSSDNIIGGHCVWLAGYDENGPHCISWGALYLMTWGFFARYTDEAYALLDGTWIAASGKTPFGMTEEQLAAQMSAIKVAA